MKWTVIAIYPNLGIKARVTEHENDNEAYDYLCGLNMCETPYVALRGGEIKEVAEYGMTREEMACIIQENC